MEEFVLAFAGFSMVAVFMALIMLKRLTPTVALLIIPVVTAYLLGSSTDQIGAMALDGVKALAPTGVMLMFAILYFGLMIDAGLFDPMVRLVVRLVEGDPLKVVLGTAVLATAVSLDGDGSTTYMIVIASMLPLYRRLGMNALNLTCVTMLASGVMNTTPWGGPLARAASALRLEPNALFIPLLPAIAAGIAGVLAIAFYLGSKERIRLGFSTRHASGALPRASLSASVRQADALPRGPADAGIVDTALEGDVATASTTARPKLLLVNAALTLAQMVCVVMQLLPLPVLFMIGFALALLINYPNMAEQRARSHRACRQCDLGRLADLCGGRVHRGSQRDRHGLGHVQRLRFVHPGILGSVHVADRGVQACRSRSSSPTTPSISACCRWWRVLAATSACQRSRSPGRR